MLKNNLEIFDLEKEFENLAEGLRSSFGPAKRISSFLIKSSFRKASQLLWWIMEPPKLWEKIGPDRERLANRKEKLELIEASMHPPSHQFLR